eukprot:974766_1
MRISFVIAAAIATIIGVSADRPLKTQSQGDIVIIPNTELAVTTEGTGTASFTVNIDGTVTIDIMWEDAAHALISGEDVNVNIHTDDHFHVEASDSLGLINAKLRPSGDRASYHYSRELRTRADRKDDKCSCSKSSKSESDGGSKSEKGSKSSSGSKSSKSSTGVKKRYDRKKYKNRKRNSDSDYPWIG